MAEDKYDHLVEIDENDRSLKIYRVTQNERHLYTSIELPNKSWDENRADVAEFCRMLGESVLLDSPSARRLLKI